MQEKMHKTKTEVLNDQDTEDDYLGFEPYVEAITDFLTDPLTTPPITISLEGQWGSGKSSFMRQIRKKLCDRNFSHCRVDFNPWRYSQNEALWAAFAVEFEKQLRINASLSDKFRLALQSLEWKKILLDSVLFLLTLICYGIYHLFLLFSDWSGLKNVQIALLILAAVSGLYPFAEILIQLRDRFISGITKVDIKKYYRERPSYHGKIPFLDQFREDLNNLAKVLSRHKRILVFIDDLDRCQPGQAAELMQAINLMLDEHLKAIFILAIDREKMAASISVENERYLKIPGKDSEPISFGLEYIDKFIQLPFEIPKPQTLNIEKLVERLLTPNTDIAEGTSFQSSAELHDAKIESFMAQERKEQAPPAEESIFSAPVESMGVVFEDEKLLVASVIGELSPLFDYNPRKVKKFINIWRVQTYLANRTGLFGFTVPRPGDDPPLKMYQLGNYLALAYIWPSFVRDWSITNRDSLIRNLVWLFEAENNSDELDKRLNFISEDELFETRADWFSYKKVLLKWMNNASLCKFLKKGEMQGGNTFSGASLRKLVTISPVFKEYDLSQGWPYYDSIIAEIESYLNEHSSLRKQHLLDGHLAEIAYNSRLKGATLPEVKEIIEQYYKRTAPGFVSEDLENYNSQLRRDFYDDLVDEAGNEAAQKERERQKQEGVEDELLVTEAIENAREAEEESQSRQNQADQEAEERALHDDLIRQEIQKVINNVLSTYPRQAIAGHPWSDDYQILNVPNMPGFVKIAHRKTEKSITLRPNDALRHPDNYGLS